MGQPVDHREPETKGAELALAVRKWMRARRLYVRLPWVAAAAALILVLALGLGAEKLHLLPQDDPIWARIQERKVFTVATDASYPPFAAVDANGNLFGLDVDVAEELGRRWAVRVEFENLAYDALLGSVISLRDDAVISAFVPQPDRLNDVTFSHPYFTGGTVVVVRKGQAGPGHVANRADWQAWAAGKTLAVERGSAGHALARDWARLSAGRALSITVLAEPTIEDALLAVENHSADAALADSIDAYNFLLGHPTVALAGPPVTPEPYTVAVSVRGRVLSQQIEQALQAMEADGTLSTLRVKWFGEAAR